MKWWYIQGFFEGAACRRTNFVVCFFSLNLADDGTPGSMYLCSVVDPGTGEHGKEILLDETSRAWYLERLGDGSGEFGINRCIAETIQKEIAEYGLYRPFFTSENPMRIAPDGVAWETAALSFGPSSISVSFTDPKIGQPVSFLLEPRIPFVDVPTLLPDGKGLGMEYVTCPRLSLKGRSGDEEIEGEAWFDCQAGGDAWFAKKNRDGRSDPLGWDWCGVNLDDGRNLLFMHRKNIESGETETKFCVLFEGGDARYLPDFGLEPLRLWESEKTHIRYPVEWAFTVPGIGCRLVFSPDTDAQEIELIGISGGIWEGSGQVSGEIGGAAVSGRGQLEVYGCGYIKNLSDFLARFHEKIDAGLAGMFPKAIDCGWCDAIFGRRQPILDCTPMTETVAKPVWDLLSRNGKHWRPIFGFLIAESMGVPMNEEIERLFILTELLHTSALIIDDIEDQSLLRRGEESVHIRYGTDVAINAASTLYFFPQSVVARSEGLTAEQRYGILTLMTETSLKAHLGQAQDIYWSGNISRENLDRWLENSLDAQLLQMYSYKTASATEGVAALSAIFLDLADEKKEACLSFGRAMGIVFQIIDDVLNFSDSPEWRKVQGEDLKAGKPTYAVIRAIGMLDGTESERLKEILCTPALREDEAVLAEGIALVRKSGAVERCTEEAVGMIEEAWKQFSGHIPPSPAKLMLRVVCANLIYMAYEV
ncbi:polyprenyl synthetase family protein [Methanoculleus sp.]|uniref:polyprenyl synthetase family protein n=1 Tax=Methanoculleus sp. TaxID=90427 RepID=UPI001BD25786